MIAIPHYEYWVEFIDYDGVQKSVYLFGQNVQQVKDVMSAYEIVVIHNIETSEPCYWGGDK